MKLFNQDGIEMMDVRSIERDDDRLLVKGKVMGAMAAKIYVKPEDMWAGLKLFPLPLLLSMPILIFKGFWRSRARSKVKRGTK
jgi:hypothetical protein